MTSEEIVALNRAHTIFSWSIQGALDPIAIDHAEGVYLYTPEGQRILDFNSQLMSVNIGHGDRRVIDAITEQALKLQYVQPAFATEIRGTARREAGRDPAGRHDEGVLHARRRRGDRERDQVRPPLHRPLQDPRALSRVPRRHRSGAMTLTGDPRRWANEPGLVGVVRYPDTHRWGEAEPRPVAREPPGPRGRHPLRGRRTRSLPSSSRRSSARTASSSRPTATSQGVREICDRHSILMVADEVMAGFGRTGRWFAVDHWDVVPGPDDDGQGPDAVVPAARRGRDAPRRSPRPSRRRCSTAASRTQSHPVACAAALATITVYEEDDLHRATPQRMGAVMRPTTSALAAKHPSVGAHRNLGLFGILDLVRVARPVDAD